MLSSGMIDLHLRLSIKRITPFTGLCRVPLKRGGHVAAARGLCASFLYHSRQILLLKVIDVKLIAIPKFIASWQLRPCAGPGALPFRAIRFSTRIFFFFDIFASRLVFRHP